MSTSPSTSSSWPSAPTQDQWAAPFPFPSRCPFPFSTPFSTSIATPPSSAVSLRSCASCEIGQHCKSSTHSRELHESIVPLAPCSCRPGSSAHWPPLRPPPPEPGRHALLPRCPHLRVPGVNALLPQPPSRPPLSTRVNSMSASANVRQGTGTYRHALRARVRRSTAPCCGRCARLGPPIASSWGSCRCTPVHPLWRLLFRRSVDVVSTVMPIWVAGSVDLRRACLGSWLMNRYRCFYGGTR